MDKSAIKTYAVEARRKLIEAVKLKAQQLYIFEDSDEYIKRKMTQNDVPALLRSDDIFLSSEQLQARERLYGELLHEGSPYKTAIYNRVMESVACTWFNRLIALRIMEVNDWLPSNIRILSSREPGRAEPDAMREVERLDYVNQAKVAELRADTTDINASEKLYKYLLISQCNALSVLLPGMFQKEHDYTELLLPDALLTKGGIVNELVNTIHEDNFNVDKQGQIEIVGWLYQYYISEKKDEVFAGLKKNIKINKDTIPAATQLFTPEWIVKYMVENSLGRLWLDTHPNADLRSKWKYYVDEAEQEPEVAEQLRVLRSQSPVKRPEDIKLIDPCMGSGHILVYAFDVLFQIYQSEGYSEREIPNLILQNNIYGLDIDDRAGQLAYFALMIKARSYNRRFFRQDNIPQTMVYAVPETKVYVIGLKKWLGANMIDADRNAAYEDLIYIAELFSKGKEYGSALKVEREVDYARLRVYVRDFASGQITIEDTDFIQQAENVDSMIDVAGVLSQKYDAVVTNPPYMGASGMSAALVEYAKTQYPDSKSDMSTIFMEKTIELSKTHGYMAMINIPVWMFIQNYEKLRGKILRNNSFVNMLHFGRGVFGADFGTTSFVINKQRIADYSATYRRLYLRHGSVDTVEQKEKWFFSGVGVFHKKQESFLFIQGSPLAYWVSQAFITSFKGKKIKDFAEVITGITTGDNTLYLRLWSEVSSCKLSLNASNMNDVDLSKTYWFPYSKGGQRRNWYGNHEYVVNWNRKGEFNRSKTTLQHLYLREAVTWPFVTSGMFSAKYLPAGSLWDVAGSPCFFKNKNEMYYVLAFLCSRIADMTVKIVNPTINVQAVDIEKLPLIVDEGNYERIITFSQDNIEISRTDWDSYETSWDFNIHPFILYRRSRSGVKEGTVADAISEALRDNQSYILKNAYEAWEYNAQLRWETLKANEEELNRIFIDIYGLQDELMPEVEDDHVTVRRADLARDIRSFVSYAVGCMFGRYSPHKDGLIFAGGKWDIEEFKKQLPVHYSLLPITSNILPIGSADYFEDDIVLLLTEFVRVVYGDGTLNENLNFIADALYPNGSGSAQERIRRYFLNDFYKDHVKIYQKKPIYWLLDSGKKDGFKALFYLHRYDKYTIARARTDYLHPLQRKYEAEIKRLDMLSNSTENAREKAAYRKEIDALQAKIDECRVYDQVVSHIAHQQIDLDLDDGVKVNYAKFQGVVVPKDDGKTETMDLLAKI